MEYSLGGQRADNLLTCVYVLICRKSCIFVGIFVFFLIVVVTVHGEVRVGNGVWIFSNCGAIFQTLVKPVLKAYVSVASLLVFFVW